MVVGQPAYGSPGSEQHQGCYSMKIARPVVFRVSLLSGECGITISKTHQILHLMQFADLLTQGWVLLHPPQYQSCLFAIELVVDIGIEVFIGKWVFFVHLILTRRLDFS